MVINKRKFSPYVNVTGYVIDNCMICELCGLLKRRRHYKLCDLLFLYDYMLC